MLGAPRRPPERERVIPDRPGWEGGDRHLDERPNGRLRDALLSPLQAELQRDAEAARTRRGRIETAGVIPDERRAADLVRPHGRAGGRRASDDL